MRYSQLFPKTVKETPKDEVATNAKLLMRGGFIDKLMAGSYTLLPLGRLVERKIEQIVREEMNKTGAQEVLMPLLHPKDIWNETGRWDSASEVMYKLEKNEKEYALSFTHEEIVMDLMRKHIRSYKDLPVKVYHFSTKFRDEPRAKSGILRGREFIMKDLYSAHETEEDLMNYYWQVAEAYLRVYERMGLKAYITEAAGGVFTENKTHEFQVLSEVGEDTIYTAPGWKFAKNDEVMTDEERNTKGLETLTSIEVGNIFPFGTNKYAEMMQGVFMDRGGNKKPVHFGSYGIGMTRLMGTVVEVSHDERGIIWPTSIAPYQVHLIDLKNQKSNLKNNNVILGNGETPESRSDVGQASMTAEKVYELLHEAGVEVLYDDRDGVGAGEKFADADLIGIPVRLVISPKNEGKIEWKNRSEKETELLNVEEVLNKLKNFS